MTIILLRNKLDSIGFEASERKEEGFETYHKTYFVKNKIRVHININAKGSKIIDYRTTIISPDYSSSQSAFFSFMPKNRKIDECIYLIETHINHTVNLF